MGISAAGGLPANPGWEVDDQSGRTHISHTETLGAIRATKPRTGSADVTRSYTALSRVVRESGLLSRARWFYLMLMGILLIALGGAITGFILLGDSWFQLLIAGALGLIFTQFAFLAHEASHRQVFESGPANDRIGRSDRGGRRRHQLRLVDDEAHASPRQPEQDRQGPRHRLRHDLVRRGGCREAARAHGAHHPQAGLPVLPAAHARGREPALHLDPHAVRPRTRQGALHSSSASSQCDSRSTSARSSGCCRSAWRSPSSACSSPCSASTWAPRSRRTTRACRSSRPT